MVAGRRRWVHGVGGRHSTAGTRRACGRVAACLDCAHRPASVVPTPRSVCAGLCAGPLELYSVRRAHVISVPPGAGAPPGPTQSPAAEKGLGAPWPSRPLPDMGRTMALVGLPARAATEGSGACGKTFSCGRELMRAGDACHGSQLALRCVFCSEQKINKVKEVAVAPATATPSPPSPGGLHRAGMARRQS